MIVGVSPKQWQAIVTATGTESPMANLAAREGLDFNDEGDRFRAREAIRLLLQPWFAQRDYAEVARHLGNTPRKF